MARPLQSLIIKLMRILLADFGWSPTLEKVEVFLELLFTVGDFSLHSGFSLVRFIACFAFSFGISCVPVCLDYSFF